MRSLSFAAVLVLAACSKKPSPEVDAGAPPALVELPRPASPSTLSIFEPADGKCSWRHEDPLAKKRVVLATFPGSCVGVRVAWSADASKAIVWFDPRLVESTGYSSSTSSPPGYPDEKVDETAKPRFFLVDTRTGKTEPLTMPEVKDASLGDLGLTARGEVVALLEESIPEGTTGTVKSGTETLDLATITEGIPVIVHAWRREGADWKRFETRLSSTGWDYGQGVRELEAERTLGPRSVELLASHAQGDSAEGDELAALKKHAPQKAKTADDGSWIFLGAGGTRVFVWEISGEFAHTTGLVVVNDAKLPELGFTDGDLVAIRSSASFLLISNSHSGTHPRLYELPAGKLAYRSDVARGVTFWPTTAKPESHESP